MATKARKTQQDQDNSSQDAELEKSAEAESSGETEPKAQRSESSPKTKARMVDAVLKTRHCRGGNCKEAGETMRMTQGEYDRLKKYGRVE